MVIGISDSRANAVRAVSRAWWRPGVPKPTARQSPAGPDVGGNDAGGAELLDLAGHVAGDVA